MNLRMEMTELVFWGRERVGRSYRCYAPLSIIRGANTNKNTNTSHWTATEGLWEMLSVKQPHRSIHTHVPRHTC